MISIFLFLFSLSLYLLTCAPDIYWSDTSKYVINSFYLIKYYIPPNSLYSIFGKIFTYFPVENIPFRINFLSCFFSSLNVVFFYLLISNFLKDVQEKIRKLVSLISSLLFLSSFTLWHFAVIADRNSFIFFIYILTLLLLFKFKEKKDIRILYLSFFLTGFSLGFSLIDYYAPFFITLFLYIFLDFKERKLIYLFFSILFFFIFGVLFFLPFNFLVIKNIFNRFDILFHYGRQIRENFGFSYTNILSQCFSLLYYLTKQIGIILGIFSSISLFYICKYNKKKLTEFIIIFFLPFLLSLLWLSIEDIFSYEHRFFSVYLLLFIFFAYTGVFLSRKIDFKLFIFLFMSIFIFHIRENFLLHNKKNLRFCREEIYKILNKVENNAIILTQNLEIKQAINYFQLIENRRRDIFVVGTANISNFSLLKKLEENKPYFQDDLPTSSTSIKIAENIDKILKVLQNRPLYILVTEGEKEMEEKALYKKISKYKRKFITKIIQFKGEKYPSPFVNNLFKILINGKE